MKIEVPLVIRMLIGVGIAGIIFIALLGLFDPDFSDSARLLAQLPAPR